MREYAKIDSCRMYIEASTSSVNNWEHELRINENPFLEYGEVEVIGRNPRSYREKKNGISSKIALAQMKGKGGVQTNYIAIDLNSKMLKENYQKGITKDTIGFALEYIDRELFEIGITCTAKDYENALLSDVDVCKDFNYIEKAKSFGDCQNFGEDILFFDYLAKGLKKMLPKELKKFATLERNGAIGFTGLELGERSSGIKALPHVTIYHKMYELIRNSSIFYERFLRDSNIGNVGRVEANFKKAVEVKDEFGGRSLMEVLEGNLDKALAGQIGKWFDIEQVKKSIKRESNMSNAKEIKIFNQLEYLNNNIKNFNIGEYAEHAAKGLKKSTANDYKNLIRKVYYSFVNVDVKIKYDSFLKMLEF